MSLSDFFIKGYAKGHYDNENELSFFDSFEFPHAEVVDELPISAENKLKEIGKFLEQEFVKKLFENAKLNRVSMWQGVDSKSNVWHNDYYHNPNSNILLYLDKNNKDVGNAIEFRNTDEEYLEYPDRGNFIMMNPSKQFEHKATHTPNTQRRLLCFDFNIPELMN